MVRLTMTAVCDHCCVVTPTQHTSESDMVAFLSGLGWVRTGAVLLCPDCAADAVCAARGCRFTEWRACRCHGHLPGHPAPEHGGAGCGVEFRWCACCTIHAERHPVHTGAGG